MHRIRPWLYVGSQRETENPEQLQAHEIGAMLQLHRHIPQEGITEKYLPVEEGYPLPKHSIEQGIQFILDEKAAGRAVLVACGAGVSRSVMFATAALKVAENLTLPEAFSEVLKLHDKAMPDELHWKSMNEYFGEDTDYWEMWRTIAL